MKGATPRKPATIRIESELAAARKSLRNEVTKRRALQKQNVRLFQELQAKNRELTTALDQQTATSEILRVISGAQVDVQPVFETITRNAARLCDGLLSAVILYDGTTLDVASHHRFTDEMLAASRRSYPRPPTERSSVGRAVLHRTVDVVEDFETDPRNNPALAREVGFRSQLSVPMLKDGAPIGVIAVARPHPGPFDAAHIELLRTFADQAVIAIENVRLVNEIAEKSHQLEVASQHKSEFLASMSHELRTPLNAIIGFSDVLLQGMFGETNEKQTEYLRDILASGQHLLSLINDILDLSKIEAGRMELDPTDFDLPTAIDNAMILMRERAGRRGIALERLVDERLGQIHADERKVKQVLLNLLSNAVKFTTEGGRIEVRAGIAAGETQISVTDTGIGIAPDDHAAAFEEFRQVGKADKRAEGTGLGLALCRKFVELHGGRIWVESELGHGSKFTFTLPTAP